jgi:tetratricopeptide (TPR) repeat protein
MRSAIPNPWFQASVLAASNIGIAMMAMGGTKDAAIVGGLTTAASVLGNLVSNTIQTDSDSKNALAELATSESIHARIADLLATIILAEKLGPDDVPTESIAEQTKNYWMQLQQTNSERLSGESFLPFDQIVVQLLNPTEQHLLIHDWIEILEGADIGKSGPRIDELRRHQLAGAITRKFPKMLNVEFFDDLRSGTGGFAEIVIRCLIQITSAVGRTEKETYLYSAAIERLERCSSNIIHAATSLNIELSRRAVALISELTSVRGVMEAGFNQISQGQEEIKNMVSSILSEMKKPGSQQSHLSAIEIVAETYGISAFGLKLILENYSKRTLAEDPLSPDAIKSAIAAGNFSLAEVNALARSRNIRELRFKAEAEISSSRQQESAALRYAGQAALLRGKPETALGYYNNSLDLANQEEDFSGWLDTKQGIRNSLVMMGSNDLAIKLIAEISTILEGVTPKDYNLIFINYHFLLMLTLQCGHFEGASRLSKNVFKIAQNNFPKNHLNYSLALYNLSLVPLEAGDYVSSEAAAKEYLLHLKRTDQVDSVQAVLGFYVLGKSERLLQKFDASEMNHTHALKLAGTYLPQGHSQLALSFNELGLVHQNLKRAGEAEQDFKMALDIERSNERQDTPDTANYAANLGRLCASQGRWQEAEENLTTSATIRNSKFGPDHPKSVEVSSQRDDVRRILSDKHQPAILTPYPLAIITLRRR